MLQQNWVPRGQFVDARIKSDQVRA